MKFILFTILVLLNLTGCGENPDTEPDPDSDPTPSAAAPASEECKTLEVIYAAYNKFTTCIVEINKVVDIKPGNQCVAHFKQTYDTAPTQIKEQMSYFPYFYNLFDDIGVKKPPVQTKPILGQTKEQKLKVEEDLKPYPFHSCWYKKLEQAYSLMDTITLLTSKDEEHYAKQCFKELGDKAYQENKAKFNCE